MSTLEQHRADAARNLAIHVYRESAAIALAEELGRHHLAFDALLSRLPEASYPRLA